MGCLPAKCDPTAISQSAKETSDPLIADHRNFYKVDGTKVDHLLYAGSNLGSATGVRGGDLPKARYPADH